MIWKLSSTGRRGSGVVGVGNHFILSCRYEECLQLTLNRNSLRELDSDEPALN